MYSLLSPFSRFFGFPLPGALAPAQSVARSLMEGAQARAGRNPQQARELRRAARAYLSVVR